MAIISNLLIIDVNSSMLLLSSIVSASNSGDQYGCLMILRAGPVGSRQASISSADVRLTSSTSVQNEADMDPPSFKMCSPKNGGSRAAEYR